MHHTPFNDARSKKLEVISFYNTNKGRVGTLDMRCSKYSANRKTRRWPLAIFYYIVGMVGSNAYTLYGMYSKSEQMTRFEFVRRLGLALAKPFLEQRLMIRNLTEDLKTLILETLGRRGGNRIKQVRL